MQLEDKQVGDRGLRNVPCSVSHAGRIVSYVKSCFSVLETGLAQVKT